MYADVDSGAKVILLVHLGQAVATQRPVYHPPMEEDARRSAVLMVRFDILCRAQSAWVSHIKPTGYPPARVSRCN